MFKPHHGCCIECKQESIIAVKKGYCQKCNWDKKQAKKKAAGKKSGKYQYVKKATGEMEMFEEIAAEREWIDFVTGEKLWELKPSQFMHVLPKALNKYPKFKLYKNNIVLGSDDTHFKWDHTPRSELRKDPKWDKLFDLEKELKNEYADLRNI